MEFFSCLAEIGETYRLLSAALKGDLDLFKRLAHEEYDLVGKLCSSKDADGRNAIHLAASAGQTHILKYLVGELKLDANVKDDEGDTPLHCAVKGKHFPTAVYLVDNGASLKAMNEEGLTSLHYAAIEGHKKLLQFLISKGAEVDANPEAGTPLQRATGGGKKDAVKVLLETNANPNIYTDFIVTPLVLAIRYGSVECAKLLLKAGADPNITVREWNPLDTAVTKSYTEMVKCLLNAGADPNVPSDLGFTPIEVAALQENRDLVMMLYPVTSPISDYPDWSVDGIMMYIESKEMKEKKWQKTQRNFMESKLKGAEAVKRMDYHDAIKWYTKAMSCKGRDALNWTTQTTFSRVRNATMYSNRSLCWARLEDGKKALEDAEMCVILSPKWPEAYYRLGNAWMLLKEFEEAADAFHDGLKLDRKNKELQCGFREAIEAQRKHG